MLARINYLKIHPVLKVLAVSVTISLLVTLIDVRFYKLTPFPKSLMLRSQIFMFFYIGFFFGIWINVKSLRFIASRLNPTWLANLYILVYYGIFVLSLLAFPMGYFLAGSESVFLCKLAFLSLGHFVILAFLSIIETVIINRILKSRKIFVSVLMYIIAVILTVDGAFRAFGDPKVNHINLDLNNFPRGLNGLTLAHISDIHIGPSVGVAEVRRTVELVNALNPDITVISGDLTDMSVSRAGVAIEALIGLKAKYGVYFATGNHDYYTFDIDNLVPKLKSIGVTPLLNERVKIVSERNGEDWFYLAGLEDISTRVTGVKNHLIDLHSALAGREKNRATILIAHQPSAMQEALEWGVELVLGGHTHGGQFFPINVPIYLYNSYFAGLYKPRPNTSVYVNTGTFFYMIPIKHIFRREIALFHLQASA